MVEQSLIRDFSLSPYSSPAYNSIVYAYGNESSVATATSASQQRLQQTATDDCREVVILTHSDGPDSFWIRPKSAEDEFEK